MTFCDSYSSIMLSCNIGEWSDALVTIAKALALGLVLGIALGAVRSTQ